MLPVLNFYFPLFPCLELYVYISMPIFLSSSLILCFFTCHFLFSYPSHITVFNCPSFNISSNLPVTLCLSLFFCRSLEITSSYLSLCHSILISLCPSISFVSMSIHIFSLSVALLSLCHPLSFSYFLVFVTF